ncbi:MFS transporter [bacterium]|nr:MAG: MFS transporter [bacterium]
MNKPRLALWLLTIIYIVNFIDRQLIAVLAPIIKQDFVLSNTEIGLLYGASFSFVYALFGIPMGFIADRLSRKKVLLICLSLWSFATLFTGWAQSVLQLVVLRMALAVFESGASPTSYSLISALFPRNEWGKRISFYASGIFIGIGLSFLLGGSISEWLNWRWAFTLAGFLGIAIAVIAVFLIPDIAHPKSSTDEKKRIGFSQIIELLANPTVRLHLLGFGLLALSGYSLLSFFSSHLNALGRPDLIKHYGWFMFGVGFMITLSGKLADKWAQSHRANRFYSGMIAAWAGLPLYWFGLSTQDGFWALLLIGCGALLASSYNGVAAAIMQDLVDENQRGLAGGVYLFVISIGGFGAGPFITGFLADTFFSGNAAISQALKLTLIISGLAGGISLWFARKSMFKDRRYET